MRVEIVALIVAVAVLAATVAYMALDRRYGEADALEMRRRAARGERAGNGIRNRGTKGLRRIGERALAVMPLSGEQRQRVERMLRRGDVKMGASAFWGVCIAAAAAGAFVGAMLAGLLGGLSAMQRFAVVAAAIIAFEATPWLAVRSRAKKRAKKIEASLPATLELLSIVVGAGQTIEQGIRIVGERGTGPLAAEFAQADASIANFGYSTVEALEQMADRVGIQAVSIFAASVTQALETGASIADTLVMQAETVTDNYYAAVEEKSNKIRTKMIFPTVFLILPTVFVLVLAPMVIQMSGTFPGLV